MGMRITIRHKLLFASFSLLIIPWLGYRYVIDMNSYLLKNQEQALLDRTRIVAAVLNERTELFQIKVKNQPTLAHQHLYVRALKTPIVIDGYSNDWHNYRQRKLALNDDDIIIHDDISPPNISATYLLGTYENHLYLLFNVKDDQVMYSQANLSPQISDHMQLAITTPEDTIKHYIISTFAPGKVNVRPLLASGRINSSQNNPVPIEAEWQEVANGYNIELRIPLSVLGPRIGFTIADVDDASTPKIKTLIGTLNQNQHAALGTIVVPSQEVEDLLHRLETPSSRTWVVDQTQRVIARTGQLDMNTRQSYSVKSDETVLDKPLSRLLLNLLLSQPSQDFEDELSDVSMLKEETTTSALNGSPMARWRHSPDHKVTILIASYPVINDQGKIIGAVSIEETSNTSLMVQNRAMEIVINLSAITFGIAAIILFAFSSRLSSRIRRLRNSTDSAIAPDGRVVGQIATTQSSDEIGDLSRSFSNMLERLSHYNRYLETMGGKLSHELRTPIAVLRSSIENLETENSKQQNAVYLERARDGIARLDLIVSRMSEATRLEQTLQTETKQDINLVEVISGCISGYR